jgi:hypothetical protein
MKEKKKKQYEALVAQAFLKMYVLLTSTEVNKAQDQKEW